MSGPDAEASPDTRANETSRNADTPRVSALHTTPDRLVLTEAGNTDGWLASDGAVALDDIV
ncbi:hypothetical protein [Salinigranum halophilum]|jgi:hypothetical protein|uniref:hypothetical protein n=1 Tax=Salinigranum halophilum TaxID=2565931 RepID=UPI0010A8CE34|nr:hypothetical protein [Salinigranum halophilum]